MPRWEVRSRDRAVQLEAPNWLVALGTSLDELGVDPEALVRMVCDVREDGSLRVREPLSGETLAIRRTVAPSARPSASWDAQIEDIFSIDGHTEDVPQGAARFALADAPEPRSAPRASADALVPAEDDFFEGWGEPGADTPPPLSMPFPQVDSAGEDDVDPFFDDDDAVSVSSRVPPSVQLALLERGLEIASARKPAEAADLALTVLRQMIPSEAGAVLLSGRSGLTFLAAQGPRAEALIGQTLPANTGLAGFVASRGESLLVNNTSADIRHDPAWDARTGYRTKAVLAVPLRDVRDQVHGCLELLNPPGRFLPWHLEAAQSVAVALAEALRALGA